MNSVHSIYFKFNRKKPQAIESELCGKKELHGVCGIIQLNGILIK